MTRPSEVLQSALTARADARRARASTYLNATAASGDEDGRWVSETGFPVAAPFAYARGAASNYFPPEGDDRRVIDRVIFVPYGLTRDAERLNGTSAADRLFRTTRAPDATGVAYYPGSTTEVAPAYLNDDTTAEVKTSSILSRLRRDGAGPGYHAVITRSGAVYVCAPLDWRSAAVSDAETAVCVAVESVAVRDREGTAVRDADHTGPQLLAMAVYVAKLRTSNPGIPLTVGDGGGVRYVVRNAETASAVTVDALSGENGDAFVARVQAETPYDLSSDVLIATPPPEGSRAEAQAVLGTTNTLGADALLLGAYASVAAEERSTFTRAPDRVRTFVLRAGTSHEEGAADAEGAHAAAASEQLQTPTPRVTDVSPHIYDYATGRWGDET